MDTSYKLDREYRYLGCKRKYSFTYNETSRNAWWLCWWTTPAATTAAKKKCCRNDDSKPEILRYQRCKIRINSIALIKVIIIRTLSNWLRLVHWHPAISPLPAPRHGSPPRREPGASCCFRASSASLALILCAMSCRRYFFRAWRRLQCLKYTL